MRHVDPERSFQTIAVSGFTAPGMTYVEKFGHTLALLSGASAYRDYANVIECLTGLSQLHEKYGSPLRARSLDPLSLEVADIPALADEAAERGVPLVVDTTYTTPFMSRPLEQGADFVIQDTRPVISAYRTGAYILLARDAEALSCVDEEVTVGAGNDTALEALVALYTLSLRLRRMNDAAHAVAAYLAASPHVEAVSYPGLRSSDQYELARRMFVHGSGPLVSFDVVRGEDVEPSFSPRWNVIRPVGTLTEAYGVHTVVTQENTADLVRFTLLLGLESIDDIVDDIEHVIRAVRSGA